MDENSSCHLAKKNKRRKDRRNTFNKPWLGSALLLDYSCFDLFALLLLLVFID